MLGPPMPDFSRLAVRVPEVLLPAPDVDLSRWAVIACDQHTSEPGYWRRVEAEVGQSPSTLRLILPEVFLAEDPPDLRIAAIQQRMGEYLDEGVFTPALASFIYVERSTVRIPRRRGLVAALDLDRYDFRPGARSLVRASESTVQERILARLEVRRGASLELPHVIVLFDDPERSVLEPLGLRLAAEPPLYDAELMLGAGRVRGWAVESETDLEAIHSALAVLARPELFRQRYGVADSDVLLFAAGDGNHALAAAKTLWEEVKAGLTEEAASRHPARHALVELVNVHDEGVIFEPIHRVVFGVEPPGLLSALSEWFAAQGSGCTLEELADEATLVSRLAELGRDPQLHVMGTVAGGSFGVVALARPKASLPAASLQGFLDAYTSGRTGARVDYIHGANALRTLAAEADRVGFLLPAMQKAELFRTIVREGALPAKTFSLGEADEKRFYLEARSLRR